MIICQRDGLKARVEKVCRTKSGGTPSRKNPELFWRKNTVGLKSGELNDSVIYSYAETITKLGLEKSNAVLYPKNTVYISYVWDNNRKNIYSWYFSIDQSSNMCILS